MKTTLALWIASILMKLEVVLQLFGGIARRSAPRTVRSNMIRACVALIAVSPATPTMSAEVSDASSRVSWSVPGKGSFVIVAFGPSVIAIYRICVHSGAEQIRIEGAGGSSDTIKLSEGDCADVSVSQSRYLQLKTNGTSEVQGTYELLFAK